MASKVAGFHHRIEKKTNPEWKNTCQFWKASDD
jgi:hypothetical protein